MPRRKGQVSVSGTEEVKDLGKMLEQINKGLNDTRSGWGTILNTVKEIHNLQKDMKEWGKDTVDREKKLAKLAKTITGLGTKQWWQTKSMVKWGDYLGKVEVRRQIVARKKAGTEDEIYDNLLKQADTLLEIQGISSALGNASEALNDIFGTMGTTINGFLLNPLTAVSALLLTFDSEQKKILENFGASGAKEFTKDLQESHDAAVLLGVDFDTMANSLTKMTNNWGISFKAATGMTEDILTLSKFTATTEENAANLVGMFMQLGGHSQESAINLAAATDAMATFEGIAPGVILDDMSEGAEVFAQFMKDGGENIAEAAIFAKKLGINLNTVGGIADGLLDFQNSLNKEIEASIILGRDINLQKARELSYTGELKEMMDEVLKQVGGEHKWAKMTRFERQAIADALNTDVLTMSKLVSKEKEAVTLTSELARFEGINPVPEESITALASMLYQLKQIGMEMARSFGPQLISIVTILTSMVHWVEENIGVVNLFKMALTAYATKVGFAIGQSLALLAVNLGLFVSEAAVLTAGIGIPVALGAAAGVMTWLGSTMAEAKGMGQAKSGGITTETGALTVHPQEAIIPLSKLPEIIAHAFEPVRRQIEKDNKKNRELLALIANGLTAVAPGVAQEIIRANESY
jgi:hypothetical protein